MSKLLTLTLFAPHEDKTRKESLGFVLANGLDPAVYSSFQQFRLLGSQKFGSGRVKKFIPEWVYEKTQSIKYKHDPSFFVTKGAAGQLLECRYFLDDSLVCSFYTYEDRKLVATKEKLKLEFKPCEISEEEYTHVVQKLDPSEFVIRSQEGSRIDLQRLASTYCSVCDRFHENENPYIFKASDVWLFNCRRSERSSRFCDALTVESDEE